MHRPDRGELALLIVLSLVLFGYVSSFVLFVLLGWDLEPVRPWSMVQVAWTYGTLPPSSAATSVAFGGAAVAALVAARFSAPRKALFGDSRFARRGELRRQRLRDPAGLLLGKVGGDFVRNDEPLHALVCAPTRSGKGVGVVVPNILAWDGSLIVLDIKAENFEITSGYRAIVGRVFKFSPMSVHTHRYNPLDAVRPDITHRLTDLQQLAAILVPAPERSGRTTMWEDEARDLFVGVALYVLDTPDVPHTIGEIYRTLKTDADLADVIESWFGARKEELDPACVQSLGSFRHKAPKERSGVKSTLTAALMLWSNPVVDAATAASDFDLRELRRRRISLYVAVPLGELPVLKRLLNLFFQQAVAVLTRELPTGKDPHQVLLMLDEFASLGRMEVLADALPFLAGFRVRMVTILQGLGQLDELYGRGGASSILQNCALQVFFAANDQQTASYVSERLGFQTVRTMSRSVPMALSSSSGSRSYAQTRRELLLPQEVRAMADDASVVFKEGCRPSRIRKIRYYRERAFSSRLLPHVRVPTLDVLPRSLGALPASPSSQLSEFGQELAELLASDDRVTS